MNPEENKDVCDYCGEEIEGEKEDFGWDCNMHKDCFEEMLRNEHDDRGMWK